MSNQLLEEVEESISSGQWDQAIKQLEELTQSEARTPEAFSKLAQANAVRGRFLTVLSVYLDWAECAVESEDFAQAERALGYAKSLQPDSLKVHEMAVRIARHNVEPPVLAAKMVELAHLYLEKGGDGERPVSLLKEAIEANPEDESLALQLGEIYISVGQISSGLKIFEDFVEKHADCGDPAKLLEPLKRINLLKADHVESTLKLGRVYLELDQVDKAEEQFRAVLRLDLNNQEALLDLALVCQRKGLFRNGLLALNRVIQLDPELPLTRKRMGQLHLASGNPEEALKEFLEAANLYSKVENTDGMVEAYRDVLRIDSEQYEALNHLRSLSFTAEYNEDLTANLFPVEEEEKPEAPQQEEAGIEEPEQDATRPALVGPEQVEPEQAHLPEPEPVEAVNAPGARLGLTKKRPALVRKSALGPAQPSKPTLRATGLRAKSDPNLRDGLNRKGQLSGSAKPVLQRFEPQTETLEEPIVEEKKVTPQQELIDVPVEVEAPKVETKPISAQEDPDDSTTEGLFPNSIPSYQQVFEEDPEPEPKPEEKGEESVPILDFDQSEDPFKTLFTEDNLETEKPEEPLNLFEPLPTARDEDESIPESNKVETPEEDSIFKGFENFDDDTLFQIDEDWLNLDETKDQTTLFPQSEEQEGFLAPEEVLEVPEDTEDSETLFPVEDEASLDWLFEPPDVERNEELETRPEALFPTTEFEAKPQTENSEPLDALKPLEQTEVEQTEESTLFDWSELEPDEKATLEPVQEQTSDDQIAITPVEALLPSEETTTEPTQENVPVPVDTVQETFPSEEEPFEFGWDFEDETTSPMEDTEEKAPLNFQDLRDVVIAELAPEEMVSDDTPELMQLLQETLPQPAEAPQEPEEMAEEAPEPILEFEQEELLLEEPEPAPPADAASRIEDYRTKLGTFPTDESATLQLADTCLRYGMLEEALRHYRKLQTANPGCLETSARIIKAALWMEDVPTVKEELWKAAKLSFDLGDLKACQDRLGDLLSLDREHGGARQLMVDVFLAGGQEKLAAWHLGQMVERAIADEDFDLAITSLIRLNRVSPSDAALERLGELYQKQNQNSQALGIFRQLRQRYLESDELAAATRLARQVVQLAPRQTEDRVVLLDLLQQQGRDEEILEHKLGLAKLYSEEQRTNQAIELLQGVLQQIPDHLDAERLLVELHLRNSSFELAEQHAESLAERFLQQKAYEKAIGLFEYWVGAAPASPRTRERLAQFYQLNGDLEGAKMEWLLVAESHQAMGDFQRAARSLERALELDPRQSEWRLRLAQLRACELGQTEAALQDFRALFQTDPTWRKATVGYLDLLLEQNAMVELGDVLRSLESVDPGSDLKDNVVSRVKEKMACEPNNLVLAFGWGELCLALGMLDIAIEQFQRLRRHETYQLHSYRLLGLCFSRKKGFNMLELALSQFRRGLALEGGSLEDRLALRYDMANVLREHDRIPEALEQLRQIADELPGYKDVLAQLEELG